MTKQEEIDAMERGAKLAADMFKPIIAKLERELWEARLEISLNKKEWKTVKIIAREQVEDF